MFGKQIWRQILKKKFWKANVEKKRFKKKKCLENKFGDKF